MQTVRRSWSTDAGGHNRILRRGFPFGPDFCATVHSVTGATLHAAVVDLLDAEHTPRRDDQLRGYVALSRPRRIENMLIAQAFSPALFRQGPLPDPL